MDYRNLADPHKYFDGIPNWIAIFKLKNGQIIGSYCQ